MKLKTIKNVINSIALIFVIIAIFLYAIDSDYGKIPELVSYIGWAVVLISELFNKLSAHIRIFFKGFFTSNTFTVYARFKSIEDFDEFNESLTIMLNDRDYTLFKNINNYNERFYSIETPNNHPVEFKSMLTEDGDDELDCVLKFSSINSTHNKTRNYLKEIDELLKNISDVCSNEKTIVETHINYNDNNNPVITELTKASSDTEIYAKNKVMKMTRDTIEVVSELHSFNRTIDDVLNGTLKRE